MAQVDVNDKVQIFHLNPNDDRNLLNKIGVVVLIVDDERCVIRLDDGNDATVDITQVKRI
jgi:hypothetical protein